MEKGKIITIEGTDCSGKETQSKMLYNKLLKDGYNIVRESFPMYSTPTGKIVGGHYLGKKCLGEPYFKEGADKVDYKVASCYFAADRRYNYKKIFEELICNGTNIIFDRYVESNMAHQGGKILDINERYKAYQFIHDLEYNLMELKKPDATIFLYMPYEYSLLLRKSRSEKPDQHESNPKHLQCAERAYLELEKIYNFKRVNCIENGTIRTPKDIHEEVYEKVKKLILK